MTAPSQQPDVFTRRLLRQRLKGSRMNPRRVIILMTLAVLLVLTVLATLFFGGIPPWPVLLCFGISHGAFCVIVARVKPYHGPYKEPLEEPAPEDWPHL